MKILFILFFTATITSTFAQEVIRGILYDYKTNKPINVDIKLDSPEIFLSYSDTTLVYKIDKNGSFTIPLKSLNKPGKTFSFSTFTIRAKNAEYYIGTEIKNIPKDSLQVVFSKIPLKRAYWRSFGGSDNLVIDNKKTFADSSFIVDNGSIKYRVKRSPAQMVQTTLDGKYITDLKTDVVR